MLITIALSWLVPSSVLHGMILFLVGLITLVFGPALCSFTSAYAMIGVNVMMDSYGWGRYGHLPHPHRESGRLTWSRIKKGDFWHILLAPPVEGHRDFVKQAGSDVLVYRLPYWRPRLLLGNEGAILHILSKEYAYSFPKPEYIRSFLTRSLGAGLFVVEGSMHKKQRKILQPAFGVSVLKELVPCFFWHARRLVDIWGRSIDSCEGPTDEPKIMGQTAASCVVSQKDAPVVDVSAWLGRTTLDVLGEAGFDWSFDSILKENPNGDQETVKVDKMHEAFSRIFTPLSFGKWDALLLQLRDQPVLRFFLKGVRVPFEKRQDDALSNVSDMASDMIKTKRQQILALMEKEEGKQVSKADWDDGAHATGGKDLLYQMLRSNLSHDLSESERMSDAELLGQMTTLIVAGHETTSTLLSWALYLLSTKPEVQDQLRAEAKQFVKESGRDELTYDDMSQLPLLDVVIKETLRIKAPVPSSYRVAAHDAVIPLSRSYPTRDGKSTFNHVLVKAGEELFLPLNLINVSEKLWGPDAMEFRPERWFDVSEAARKSGMPLHLMSFISGPRGCIGNRFGLAEAKALLFTIILAFSYETVDGWEYESKQAIVLRSQVRGQPGLQMPLRVRRVSA